MSQEVQGMLIQIEATTAQLRREMAKADGLVASSTKKIDAQLSKVDHAFDRMNVTADGAVRGVVSGLKGIVAPALAAASALSALRKGVDVQREFDRLNAGLITATGSSEKAAVAFEALREFAQKTPYDLGQAVEGFTKLVNLGLTPSEQALMSYGNTASSMGKDLNQMIEAVADAATGEFERLKEFGIKASKEGDRVSLTFQGVTTNIGNNAAEIEKYLIGLGENQFAGAMELRMQTLDGAIANLGDTWDQTFRLINDAGAGELMRGAVVQVVEALDELNAMLASGELEGYLDALGGKFDGWGADIETTLNTLGEQFDSLFTEMSKKGESDLGLLTDSFRNFPENVRAFVQLMTVEVLSAFDKASAYAVAFKDGVKALFSDDTLTDANARLQAELGRLNGIRDESISAILSERDAAVGSYEEQLAAAAARRAAYEEERKARAKDTADRLAQFKVEADGQDGVTDATGKNTKALNEQAKAIDSVLAKALPEKKRLEDLVAGIKNLQAAHAKGKITALELAQGIKTLNEEYARPAVQKRTAEEKKVADQIKKVDDAVQGVLDRLDPAAVAARKYREEQAALNEAMKNHPERADEYRTALGKLETEYQNNRRAASEWGQFTERALDSVDQSFADAWKNIGQGFSGFADGLKNAFKNLLAELAHMAITRPIVMQIGAAIGIGGGAGQATAMFGGGSGGFNVGQLASYGQSAYSALTGWGQAAYTGWQNGGVTGAYNGVTGYYGDMFSGAYNTVSGALGYGNGANIAGYTGQAYANWAAGGSQAIGASQAGYTGAQYSAWVGQQNAAATAGTYAPWLSAASGAYMGYQQSGAKGAVAGGVGGWGGAKLGASAGSYFGPIGTAVGAVLGGVLGSIGGSKIFGGDWQTKDVGLAFSVENGDFIGQQYKYQKKKGGLFSSNKKRTRFSALDDETAARFQSVYDATEDTVAGLFESLSYSVEEASLDGLQLARTKISTKGKTEEEIQQAIAEWFGSAADAMTAELNKVFATGLDLDLEGMQAFVGNLQGVNEVLRYLDVGMYDASVAGGKLAEALSAAAGGLDALATNSATYYGAFFSEAEKIEDTIDSIKRAFESADVELVSSREAYRAMVEDIDLTTEAGQKMFATMMALSGQAAQYYSIVEQQAAAAAAQALANTQLYYEQFTTAGQKTEDVLAGVVAQFEDLELALPGTRDGFIAAVDALDTTTEAGKKMFDTLMGVAGAADAYYDILEQRASQAVGNAYSLLERSVNAEKAALTTAYQQQKAEQDALLQQRREMQQQYHQALSNSYRDMAQTATATASALGSLSSALAAALGQLVDDSAAAVAQRRSAAVVQLQQALRTGNVSNVDQLVEAAGVAAKVDAGVFSTLADYQREQGLTANLLADLGELTAGRKTTAERQAEALQKLAEQSASNAQAFSQSVGSVKTSLDLAYEAELAALDQQLALGKSQIDALNGIDNSVVSVADAVAGLTAAITAAMQQIPGLSGLTVPGFASGGMHAGGLRLVGENGPELEVTGPARIYNAADTAAMLQGGSNAGELQALRAEVSGLKQYLYQITKNTGRSSESLRNIEEGAVIA